MEWMMSKDRPGVYLAAGVLFPGERYSVERAVTGLGWMVLIGHRVIWTRIQSLEVAQEFVKLLDAGYDVRYIAHRLQLCV